MCQIHVPRQPLLGRIPSAVSGSLGSETLKHRNFCVRARINNLQKRVPSLPPRHSTSLLRSCITRRENHWFRVVRTQILSGGLRACVSVQAGHCLQCNVRACSGCSAEAQQRCVTRAVYRIICGYDVSFSDLSCLLQALHFFAEIMHHLAWKILIQRCTHTDPIWRASSLRERASRPLLAEQCTCKQRLQCWGTATTCNPRGVPQRLRHGRPVQRS